MVDNLDFIALYAREKNFKIQPRTIFVEGITDVKLFELAAQLEKEQTGIDLLGNKLAIIAAGEGDDGGAKGVCRELVVFKNISGRYLLPSGRPKYRFIGLFDNDKAGRQAVSDVRKTDTSILEFKDVFRLWPVMPQSPNRDPDSLRKSFELENGRYKIGTCIDWELEDLLPKTLTDVFLDDFPTAVIRSNHIHDKTHRDWTPDGKAQLHRFIKQNAIRSDLDAVIGVLRVFWHYLGIKPDSIPSSKL